MKLYFPCPAPGLGKLSHSSQLWDCSFQPHPTKNMWAPAPHIFCLPPPPPPQPASQPTQLQSYKPLQVQLLSSAFTAAGAKQVSPGGVETGRMGVVSSLKEDPMPPVGCASFPHFMNHVPAPPHGFHLPPPPPPVGRTGPFPTPSIGCADPTSRSCWPCPPHLWVVQPPPHPSWVAPPPSIPR